MVSQTQNDYPAVNGLIWHRDRFYSFFIPNNWHQFRWSDGRRGVIYGPDPADPQTVFAVDIKHLGTSITADDLDVLAEGFFESIDRLPQVHVDSLCKNSTGRLLELEAQYTFQEQGSVRKRWVRLFYFETRQIAMTAQGAAPEKYDYWLPWFFEAMMTAQIHNTKPRIDLGH